MSKSLIYGLVDGLRLLDLHLLVRYWFSQVHPLEELKN